MTSWCWSCGSFPLAEQAANQSEQLLLIQITSPILQPQHLKDAPQHGAAPQLVLFGYPSILKSSRSKPTEDYTTRQQRVSAQQYTKISKAFLFPLRSCFSSCSSTVYPNVYLSRLLRKMTVLFALVFKSAIIGCCLHSVYSFMSIVSSPFWLYCCFNEQMKAEAEQFSNILRFCSQRRKFSFPACPFRAAIS